MDRHLGIVDDLFVDTTGVAVDMGSRRGVAFGDIYAAQAGFWCATVGGEYQRLSRHVPNLP